MLHLRSDLDVTHHSIHVVGMSPLCISWEKRYRCFHEKAVSSLFGSLTSNHRVPMQKLHHPRIVPGRITTYQQPGTAMESPNMLPQGYAIWLNLPSTKNPLYQTDKGGQQQTQTKPDAGFFYVRFCVLHHIHLPIAFCNFST